jgi:hypothetical protein
MAIISDNVGRKLKMRRFVKIDKDLKGCWPEIFVHTLCLTILAGCPITIAYSGTSLDAQQCIEFDDRTATTSLEQTCTEEISDYFIIAPYGYYVGGRCFKTSPYRSGLIKQNRLLFMDASAVFDHTKA